ncbi:uncharacterized protein LOC125112493 [Phacochoerus africanus]|uniref:uncharacterized protein LOC125112493 n=1 Tax=Phacochoerus africanus TaxID=41426 RepID=UPI001FD93899|nr:uncharacterized protein LOC125112493 [Phacochoerus africanus]
MRTSAATPGGDAWRLDRTLGWRGWVSSGKPGRGQFTREERERRGGKGRDEASQEFHPQETRVRGEEERRPEDPSFSGAGTRAAETEDSAVEEGDHEAEESVGRASDPAGAGRETAPTCFRHNRGMLPQRGQETRDEATGPEPEVARAPSLCRGCPAVFLLQASSPAKGRPWAVAGNPAGPASPSAEAGTHALVIARQHRCLSLQHLRDLRQEAGPSSPVRPSKVLPPAYSCQLNARRLFMLVVHRSHRGL